MAKQKGIIKLDGTIGDITFLKTQDGYLAKEKSEIKKGAILTGEQFERTRENMAEFSRAGYAAKLLRDAFAFLGQKGDNRVSSRLCRAMMQVLKSDINHDRGQRTVSDGNLVLLEGFDFNINAQLTSTLKAPYSISIDRVSGDCTVDVPSFVPKNMISAPSGSTHFRIIAGAVAINFMEAKHAVAQAQSPYLALDNTATALINLSMSLPAASADPLLLVLGIEFIQEVNGKQYPLNNGAYNALTIAVVEA